MPREPEEQQTTRPLIRRATTGDVDALHSIAWESFRTAIAPGSSEEGIAEYRRFCAPQAMRTRMLGEHRFWIVETGDAAAMGELKGASHLAMLFVRSAAQHRGLGSLLLAHLMAEAERPMTVSASPNAVPFYARHGFEPTDAEQEKGGIRFLPMRYTDGKSSPGPDMEGSKRDGPGGQESTS